MKNIILAILLTITLTSFAIAAENGVGMGDSVYNSIVRAENITNSTIQMNTTIRAIVSNVTYIIVADEQANRIEAKVGNTSEAVTSSIQTINSIQEKVVVINNTVVDIRDNKTQPSNYLIIALLSIVIILGIVTIVLVFKKKRQGVYRCSHCRKLYMTNDRPEPPQDEEYDEEDEEEE